MIYSTNAQSWIEQQARRKQREAAGVPHPTNPRVYQLIERRFTTAMPNTDPRVAKWQRNWGHF